MEILVIAPFFAPYSGVGANRMVSLVNHIKNMYKVTVVRNYSEKEKNNYNADEPENVEYHNIRIVNDDDHKEMERLYADAVLQICKERDISLAITSVGPYYTYKCVSVLKRQFDIPIILDFRDLFVYEKRRHDRFDKEIRRFIYHKKYTKVESEAVKNSDCIICVTADDLYRMQRAYNRTSDDSCLIMNGYDEKRLKDLTGDEDIIKKNEDTLYIGVLGKFSTYNEKLFLQLLKAVSELISKGYKIKIVHIGIREEKVFAHFKKKEIQDSYIYLGNRDYAEAMSIMGKMDAFTFVYTSETGYGTKIFDYIYLDKPIIMMTRRNTELAGMVSSFENGYVCTNYRQYIDALNCLFTDNIRHLDEKYEKESYSRERANVRFEEIIQKLINRNSLSGELC